MEFLDEQKEDEQELSCGWRRLKPKFLQKLNTPKWFLVFLTIYSFMQGKIEKKGMVRCYSTIV